MIEIHLTQMMLNKSAEQKRLITIDEIAKETGLGRNTLSRIKNNSDHKTTTDVIDKLCAYFDCKIEDLVTYSSS
jgi:DNA-binding Xre family transcriptional regulator